MNQTPRHKMFAVLKIAYIIIFISLFNRPETSDQKTIASVKYGQPGVLRHLTINGITKFSLQGSIIFQQG
ncbi:hypothetical protein XELAEV_18013540mg [Xenopus laevis]|uniref:Uncharacterized protein n=1 Tax=Xenopus laevis TaxID=8355 RepID=A0A974DPS3_XENLA|nr:hypothetical protein XELAEV_18013540mg [Xenopus laevis]